jgi:pimeloyl-ACP methyl ester carboxylesterase
MTASVATPTEKITVHGVNLEVLRLPASPLHLRADLPASISRQPATLVFLHEGLGSVAMWHDFPAKLCAATGYAGLVYSRQGYGQSDARPDVRGAGRLQPDYMHREAWHVLPELLRACGIEQAIMLGHSDGGTIALLYAAKFPATACIVMAPHLFVEDISIHAITQARAAYERGDLRSRLAQFHADVDGAFWQWNDIWLSPAFRNFNIEEECKHITCPVLAIQGHDDPYGTMAQIDALAHITSPLNQENAASPSNNKARVLLKLEQCGHSPHRDQAASVIQAITSHLAVHTPPTSA